MTVRETALPDPVTVTVVQSAVAKGSTPLRKLSTARPGPALSTDLSASSTSASALICQVKLGKITSTAGQRWTSLQTVQPSSSPEDPSQLQASVHKILR